MKNEKADTLNRGKLISYLTHKIDSYLLSPYTPQFIKNIIIRTIYKPLIEEYAKTLIKFGR